MPDIEPDSAHQRSKRPVTPLAGPYGHPFHPILVTIPIGAWVCSLAFDVGSRMADEPPVYARGAYWLIGLGILGALGAALFGLLDLRAIPKGTPAFTTGVTHLALNVGVVVAFGISFLIRRGDDLGEVSTGLIALSVVALAALGLSGWLGGKLTYRYGVRVADEATQAEGFTS
jgi:uncharacterized membrane protein